MGTARWVLIGLSALALALAVARHAPRMRAGAVAPPAGAIADFRADWSEGWQTVARIPAADAGVIRGLAARGDTVVLLRRDGWLRITAGEIAGPFGATEPQAPSRIRRAVAVAASAGRVYVLDAGAQEVSIWDMDGRYEASLMLRAERSVSLLPEELGVDESGSIHVSARAVDPAGWSEWLLLRFAPASASAIEPGFRVAAETPDTLYRGRIEAPASAFRVPRFGVLPSGGVVLRVATEPEVTWLDAAGGVTRSAVQAGAPSWPVPDSIRRQHAGLLSRLPAELRAPSELPRHWPPTRALAVTAAGDILVLLNAGADELHVEVLDRRTAVGIGRLTERPVGEPLYLTPAGVYRVVDEPEMVRIDVLALWIPEVRDGDGLD